MRIVEKIEYGMSAPTSMVINGALIALPVSAVLSVVLAFLGYLIPVGIFVVIAVQLFAGYSAAAWLRNRS